MERTCLCLSLSSSLSFSLSLFLHLPLFLSFSRTGARQDFDDRESLSTRSRPRSRRINERSASCLLVDVLLDSIKFVERRSSAPARSSSDENDYDDDDDDVDSGDGGGSDPTGTKTRGAANGRNRPDILRNRATPSSFSVSLSLSLSHSSVLLPSSLPSSSVLFRPLIPPTSSISTGNCFPFHCPARMLLSHSRIPSRSLSLSFSLAISPWLFNAPFLRASSTTAWEKARRKGRGQQLRASRRNWRQRSFISRAFRLFFRDRVPSCLDSLSSFPPDLSSTKESPRDAFYGVSYARRLRVIAYHS